jgi:cytochrome c oxidase subunit 4
MSQSHIVPVKTYLYTFVALLFLAGLTTAVAFVDLGRFNTVIAMGIALVKMILVLLIFMHLRSSAKLVRVVFIAGFFWLALLIGLTMTDYTSRSWIPDPAPWSMSARPTHP